MSDLVFIPKDKGGEIVFGADAAKGAKLVFQQEQRNSPDLVFGAGRPPSSAAAPRPCATSRARRPATAVPCVGKGPSVGKWHPMCAGGWPSPA